MKINIQHILTEGQRDETDALWKIKKIIIIKTQML